MSNTYPTDRRASSAKRDNDVLKTKWPAITRTAYMEAYRKADEMDPKLRALCQARLKMGQAINALQVARKRYQPQQSGDGRDAPTYNELRKIATKLDDLYLKFPLEIK